MLNIDDLYNDISEKQLDDILRAGEGQQIEFKEAPPSISDLGKQVSAFANSQGGVLVIGARETKPQIVYSGSDPRVDQCSMA